MSKVSELFSRARRETPPPGMISDIERNVMRHVSQTQAGKHKPLIRPLPAIATAAALVASLLIVVLHSPKNKPQSAPQFVESILVLNDHICIWLEPVDNIPGGR